MEVWLAESEQSKEARMSARRDGGADVRVERRRHWSDEEKLAILKETTQPGAVMAVVARRYGLGTGQLYTWSRQLYSGAMSRFFPVDMTPADALPMPSPTLSPEIPTRCGIPVSTL